MEKPAQNFYTWSDAWLLLSIFWAHRASFEANLESIIAHGDYIQHAIFTYEEINNGLQKLLKCLLVKKHKKIFILTENALEIYNSMATRRNGMLNMQDAIEKLINKNYVPIGSSVQKNKIVISQAEYQLAVKKYLKQND